MWGVCEALLATSSYMQILTNRSSYRQVRQHGIEVQWTFRDLGCVSRL